MLNEKKDIKRQPVKTDESTDNQEKNNIKQMHSN